MYFWFSLIKLIPKSIKVKRMLKDGQIEESEELITEVSQTWARKLIEKSRSKVEVIGAENLPKNENFTIISNHQGYFDIPIILGYLDTPKAFISKTEMEKIPMLSNWMRYMGCIFMDRSTAKSSLKGILDGVKVLKNRKSIVIFPEGTRTETGELGEFKEGAFKLATKSKTRVLPVTLIGSDKVMKKGSLKVNAVNIKMIIDKPIEMTEEYQKNTVKLSENTKEIILSNLKKY